MNGLVSRIGCQDIMKPCLFIDHLWHNYYGFYGEDDDEWHEGWTWYGKDTKGRDVITHWQPLPEPPKDIN